MYDYADKTEFIVYCPIHEDLNIFTLSEVLERLDNYSENDIIKSIKNLKIGHCLHLKNPQIERFFTRIK